MLTREQFYKSKQWESFRKVIIADRSDQDGFVHCAECGKPIINKYFKGNFKSAENIDNLTG